RFGVAARVLFDLGGLGVVVAVHARHHGDLVAFTQAHDAHAAAVAALHVDVRRMDADQDPVGTDKDEIVAFIHDLDARHAAFGVVADPQPAAVGDAVIVDAAAASLAVLGDGQHRGARAADARAHHVVALAQFDDPHAVAGTAHGPGSRLGKADGRAVVGGDDDLVVALGQMAPHQAVAFIEAEGDEPRLADVAELGQRRALDQPLPRHHRQ